MSTGEGRNLLSSPVFFLMVISIFSQSANTHQYTPQKERKRAYLKKDNLEL